MKEDFKPEYPNLWVLCEKHGSIISDFRTGSPVQIKILNMYDDLKADYKELEAENERLKELIREVPGISYLKGER